MTFGKIYLIPNTLGNPNISNTILPYNIEIIKTLDTFIVENIKTAVIFLQKINIDTKGLKFMEYSVKTSENDYFSDLKNGKNIGLISEAGLPCIGDPGAKIVLQAHKFGINVMPLVGASSIILSLIASGFNGQNFAFNGYLPIEKTERIKQIKFFETISKKSGQTQIFIETPHRNNHLFEAFLENCNENTYLCVASNITCDDEFIKTDSIKNWKKNIINLPKIPTIFIIYVENGIKYL